MHLDHEAVRAARLRNAGDVEVEFAKRTKIVEADYCMENGRLILRVQEALLLYHLDHLGLLEQTENPRKHIALANRNALQPFFQKHGIGKE